MGARAGPGHGPSCSQQGSTLPKASQERKENLPASERPLWAPWCLGKGRLGRFCKGPAKRRKGLGRIAGDAPELPRRPRRFGRDQVPASVAATESLHRGRASACPATRSCFPNNIQPDGPGPDVPEPGLQVPSSQSRHRTQHTENH